jgi:hypothetical protein
MTDPTDKNEDKSEEGFFMAGFSGATGVPLKQMQDAIAQSTAYLNFTLDSSNDTTTVEYPDGKNKNNMTILSVAVYRNANWYYAFNAVTPVLTNSNIGVQLDSNYSYFKGLPCMLIYR